MPSGHRASGGGGDLVQRGARGRAMAGCLRTARKSSASSCTDRRAGNERDPGWGARGRCLLSWSVGCRTGQSRSRRSRPRKASRGSQRRRRGVRPGHRTVRVTGAMPAAGCFARERFRNLRGRMAAGLKGRETGETHPISRARPTCSRYVGRSVNDDRDRDGLRGARQRGGPRLS